MPVLVQRHGRTQYVGSQASYIIWGEAKSSIISRLLDEVGFCLEIAKVVTFTMANPETVNFEFEIAKLLSDSLEVNKANQFELAIEKTGVTLKLAIEKVITFSVELARDVKNKLGL